MQCEGGADKSPRLIEAEVEDGIEELLALVVWPYGAEPERGGHVAWTDRSASAGEVDSGPPAAPGAEPAFLERKARGEAAAELQRVGNAGDADGTGVAAEALRGDRISAGVDHVEERPDAARREAGELQEGAVHVHRGAAVALGGSERRGGGAAAVTAIVALNARANVDVGAQRAVFGLLAHIDAECAARLEVKHIRGASERTAEIACTRLNRAAAAKPAAAASAVTGLQSRECADLDAGVGSGDVPETR